jgi:hypothetical protein
MKRIALGIFLAVVASAITAGAVAVVGQQGGGEEPPVEGYIPPTKALKPSELTKIPPGTPVAELTLPVDYGPFRIIPQGSAPSFCGLAAAAGVEKAGMDVTESDTLDDFRDHDLFIEPPYIPAGWELTEAHAETVIWDDGSQTDSMFALEYQRPEYFYIGIGRRLTAGDCKVERVGHTPESQHAYTLGEIRGVPVLFQHQAPGERIQALLQATFVVDNVVTGIETVAIDFDELIKIADALIAEMQQASS